MKKIKDILSSELIAELYRTDRIIKPSCIAEYTDPKYKDLMNCIDHLQYGGPRYLKFDELTISKLNELMAKMYEGQDYPIVKEF